MEVEIRGNIIGPSWLSLGVKQWEEIFLRGDAQCWVLVLSISHNEIRVAPVSDNALLRRFQRIWFKAKERCRSWKPRH